jgi:hypothetical protein
MGDGPITSPSQVPDDEGVPIVPPTRVDCASLPADSPFRQPGQVCAPAPSGGGVLDYFLDVIHSASAPTSAAAGGDSDNTKWLLLGALGVGAYLLTRKKKGR